VPHAQRHRQRRGKLASRPERRFWFQLAGHLGYTVGELQQRIGSREFSEWQEYAKHEPLLHEKLDILAADIATAAASSHPYLKKPPKWKDYSRKWWTRPKARTVKELYAQLYAAFPNMRRKK